MTNPKVSKSWSTTDAMLNHARHSWSIGNPRFLFSKKENFCLESCPFEAGPATGTGGDSQQPQPPNWKIRISVAYTTYFGFYLVYVPPVSPSDEQKLTEIPVQFTLEVQNSAGTSILRSASELELFGRHNAAHGFDKFAKKDVFLKSIVQDHHITVVCELNLMTKPERLSGKGDIIRFNVPCSTLARDLEAIYSRKVLTDVTFVVGEQEFEAHKPILMARSPVFAAMFNTDMLENLHNRVEIEDIKANVFRELLRFVYTDQVLNVGKHTKELLMAADKYELAPLKAMCEQELFEKLSVETAAKTLMLADLYNAEKLKQLVISFAWLNREKVVSTKAWQALLEQKPWLVADVLHLGAKKRKLN